MSSSQDAAARALTAAEVRHRLANLFQLLSTLMRMRIHRAPDGESRRQLSWMLEAVAALGALQQCLIDAADADFAMFLSQMLPHWRRRCAGRPIQIELEAAPTMMREQLASALAVVVNELVSNAIAHAHPDARAGAIRITLAQIGDARAVLTVSDDGVGYQPGMDDRAKLGLWLIRGLTDQVKGVMATDTHAGVTARLEFPLISEPTADPSAPV